mgnify:CR=1 FL=1
MVVPVRLRLLVGIWGQVITPLSPFRVALRARCPRCGKGKLYKGLTALADNCAACGLSFKDHDSGDGPAFFTITVLGFIVAGAAIMAEIFYKPDYWIHLVLWPPLLLGLTPISLRFFKSYLLAWQYKAQLLKQDVA